MQPTLQINLLGTPYVILDDNPVVGFISVKSQALLYYLAVEGGIHARLRLAALLWPDAPERRGLKNVRDVLANLRHLVGDYLEITRRTVALRPETIRLDVREFRAVMERQNPEPDRIELTAALAHYRDDFLSGFHVEYAPEFENWASLMREQLHQQAEYLLQALAEQHLAAGNYAAGLEINHRLLGMDPGSESAHRQRMRLLALSGERTAVMRQYETLRRLLAKEYGVEPLEETQRLAKAIAAGELQPPGQRPLLPNSTTQTSSPTAPRSNLPRILTPLFGRADALAAVTRKVLDRRYPLVTIVGVGGVGKTRLALTIATQNQSHFTDGAWFVDLSHVTLYHKEIDEEIWDTIAAAIAHAMDIRLGSSSSLTEQLCDALRGRDCLIILDNFEQIVEAATLLVQLLDATREAQLIVTSRARLPLQAAWTYQLEGLPVPDSDAVTNAENPQALAERYASLQLFAERAGRQAQDFQLTDQVLPDVVAICRLVAGLPLGIELAAALLQSYAVSRLATILAENLGVLAISARDLPERHRSLQAAFETSWRLLSDPKKRALALSTVFRGSFTANAARDLTGAAPETLEALAAMSLLEITAPHRYKMNSVIRHFALVKRAEQPEDEEEILRGHGRYFMLFLRDREERLMSDPRAIHEVRVELDNVQAAWQWACETRDLSALDFGMRGLSDTGQWSGLFRTGEAAFSAAVEAVRAALAQATRPDEETQRILGMLLLELSFFRERLGRIADADDCAQEARQLGEQLDNAYLRSGAALRIAAGKWRTGNLDEMRSETLKALALAQQSGLHRFESSAQIGLGLLAIGQRDYATALDRLSVAQQLTTAHNLQRREGIIALNLGMVYLELGNTAAMEMHYRRAVELCARFDDQPGMTQALLGVALSWLAWGKYTAALPVIEECLDGLATEHDRYGMFMALYMQTFAHLGLQERDAALDAATKAVALAQDAGYHPELEQSRLVLGAVLSSHGETAAAREVFLQVLASEPTKGIPLHEGAHIGLADMLLADGDVAGALSHVEQVLPYLEERPFSPSNFGSELHLVCHEVLHAAADPRALPLLERAHAAIQRVASTAPDEATRASYLNNVPANRYLSMLYASRHAAEVAPSETPGAQPDEKREMT